MREFQDKVDVKVSISCITNITAGGSRAERVLARPMGVESCSERRFIFLFDSIGRMSHGEEKRGGK